MIRIRDLSLPPDGDMARLVQAAARQLRISPNEIKQLDLKKKSVDARKKNDVRIIYTVDVAVKGREDKILKMAHSPKASIARDTLYSVPQPQALPDSQPIIVGFGPAGMFAALVLSMAGLRPLELERGQDAKTRQTLVQRFWETGALDPSCNVQFGEGGAGTFSDGKLFTRSSKRGDNREVLYQFVNFGADPSIIVDAHPHIGTDKLPRLVSNIRECIIEHGGEYHFQNRVSDIERAEDGVITVTAIDEKNDNKTLTYKAKAVILATGHSARDVYEMLQGKGCELQAKGFAMGVRVEHPQALINKIRYRGQWEPGFPAAEYSFVEQVDDRGVFSFCMCPGGILVPSSTEDGYTVLNGMSNSARNSKWANAGVVVSIEPDDVPEEYKKDGVFSLLNFQHDVEKKMFDYAAEHAEADENGVVNKLCAPAQRMVDFCEEQMSEDLPETSYRPGVVSAPLYELLPECVSSRLQKVFPLINNKMRGYYTEDALLLGVESRTSSPVRIVRGDDFQCPQVPGLFPCGEGAGYSGGIVSSAIDGINCAVAAAKLF